MSRVSGVLGVHTHESILAELSCTFFQTTIEFRPALLAQRADACAKGQTRRAAIYDELIAGLDTTEAS